MFQAVARGLVAWHLLSLDAPSVAVVWTLLVARSAGVALSAASAAAMFLAVWILYAADRLLDGLAQGADADAEMEPRHRFHARHRRRFQLWLATASVALTPLLLLIPPESMRLYLELAALLLAWFLLIHLPADLPKRMPDGRANARPARRRRLPKELAVGLFFAAAVFVPTVAREPDRRPALLVPAALFAGVCCLNCLLIYRWEHPALTDRAHAHPATRLAVRWLNVWAWALLAGALLAGIASRSSIAFCIAASAALLLLLDRFPPRNATLLRASADLALLTPLLFLW